MKAINIKEVYYAHLQLLVRVSGKSQSKVINEVMPAGLIEAAQMVLAEHDSQTINNPPPSSRPPECSEPGPAVE